jgi:hypothetical protein
MALPDNTYICAKLFSWKKVWHMHSDPSISKQIFFNLSYNSMYGEVQELGHSMLVRSHEIQ